MMVINKEEFDEKVVKPWHGIAFCEYSQKDIKFIVRLSLLTLSELDLFKD